MASASKLVYLAVARTTRPRARANTIATANATTGDAVSAPTAIITNTAAVMMYVATPVPICQPKPTP